MLGLAQLLSTKKKGGGVEYSNVLRRVCMHICLSVIKLFALKTIFRYIHKRFELGIFQANQTTKCLRNHGRTKGEGWSTEN